MSHKWCPVLRAHLWQPLLIFFLLLFKPCSAILLFLLFEFLRASLALPSLLCFMFSLRFNSVCPILTLFCLQWHHPLALQVLHQLPKIYGVMDRENESIAKAFNGNENSAVYRRAQGTFGIPSAVRMRKACPLLQQNEDENGVVEDDFVLGEEGFTWEAVGDAYGANELAVVTRHQSRLTRAAAVPTNEDEEEEEQEFELSDEQDNTNVVELRSEDEEDADVAS